MLMKTSLKIAGWLVVIFIMSLKTYAQQDVTRFLGIAVDGYKSDMIKKLKAKGFTSNPNSADVLEGEFNGTEVNIYLGTINNKVWRLVVSDTYTTDETNIKIRFNELIQQFRNNERYMPESDSIIATYIIHPDEDISYEMLVNKKRYEAAFYQKTLKYDALVKESTDLMKKEVKDEENIERLQNVIMEAFKEIESSKNKSVWFMIHEDKGAYRILIYYDNEYNNAKGKDL